MYASGVTMGLAEWIIDDTCLVIFVIALGTWNVPVWTKKHVLRSQINPGK